MKSLPAIVDEVSRECVAVRLRRINRVVSAIYEEAARPYGVKATQYSLLVATACLGLARPQALCQALSLDESTFSRNAERLKSRGWIEVVPDPADGRAQPLRVTSSGEELIRTVYPAWRSAQSKVKDLLGAAGISAVEELARHR